MKFKQNKDGGCDIEFNDEEIKIMIKQKKLTLTSSALRHFSNNLMNMIVMWHKGLKDKDKNTTTFDHKVDINA